MTYFTVTSKVPATGTYEGDEDEAVSEFCDAWHLDIEPEDLTVRPATVREVLAAEYGPEWDQENYRSGMSHVFSVTERTWFTYVTEPSGYRSHVWHAAPIIVLNHTCGRDVQGYEDPVCVANYRVLKDQWSECEGLTDGPYSGSSHIALDLDSPAPEDLAEVLNGLADYPCVDDEEVSRVEQEMIEDHWESYGKNDVLDAVAKALGLDNRTDLSEAAEDIVTQLVWEGIISYGYGDGYPEIVDVSYVNFGEAEVARWIKVRAIGGGNGYSGKTRNGYGDRYCFDLSRSNLVAA